MSRIQDQFDIVLFDGVCNLCNSAVDLIVRNDKEGHFKVGALQDDKTKEILKDYNINEDYLDSIILIRGDKVFYKSRAALEITKNLKGAWPLLYGLIVVPGFVRVMTGSPETDTDGLEKKKHADCPQLRKERGSCERVNS